MIVAGRIRLWEGRVEDVDAQAVLARARQKAQELWARI